MRILVATRSAHKLEEIRRIVDGAGPGPEIDLVSLTDFGIDPSPDEEDLEPFETFEENARSKARYFHSRSGIPTIADDSGISVDALDGAPGVRSKRFAPSNWGDSSGVDRDETNNRYLLHRLEGVPTGKRGARYVCAAVWVGSGPEATFRGEAPGRILDAPVGVGGFGYDPLFFDPELNRTFAELSSDEKHARSHRGHAFRALFTYLNPLFRAESR